VNERGLRASSLSCAFAISALALLCSVVFGSAAGNWQYSAQNIIGFKFVVAAGTTHYGWMRFDLGSQPATGNLVTRTMVDYSWETTPNTSIIASAGAPDAVPEPTSMLYTLLTLSSGLLLRRRGKVSV
jgi:hypothetical protein